MANTELRLFQYFVTLCEEGNFARAAERLAITPPTLTHQIQKLEKGLNVRLLNRRTKMKLELTEAGARFLESARDVLHWADEAEKTARKAARGEIGRLEIGYMLTTAYSGLMQSLLNNFQARYPGIDITLHQVSTVDLADKILSNELDVGFARLLNKYPKGLSGVTFHRAPIVLALPSSHPLARKKAAVNPKALVDETFVSTTLVYESAFTRHVDSIASLFGFTPKISKRADDLTTVLTYVSLGYGIAAVSSDLEICQIPNVTFKNITAKAVPQVEYTFMHRTNETTPAIKVLIESMRKLVAKSDVPRHD